MNAEQLNGILKRLVEGHRAQGTVKKMAAVRASLEAIANEPGNAAHQTQFREQLTPFVNALRTDSLNVFSVREDSLIDDLSLRTLVGSSIEKNSIEIMSGQELTPRVAADAFIKLHDAFQAKLNRIKDISNGLTELGIDDGEPFNETVELGLFIPRDNEDLSLSFLLKEGEELNRLISASYEVIQGSPESPAVRYLTSSDYGFLLDVAPQVAAFLAVAVERSMAMYKTWLETRLLHQQLKDGGASAQLVGPLEEEAKNQRDAAIHRQVLTAVQERSPSTDEGRKNELANQVVAEIKIFLNKAERGNYLDIRVGAYEEKQEGSDSPETEVARKQIETLKEVSALARRLHALEKREDWKKLPSPEGD